MTTPIHHSDPRKGEFTPTSLETFLQCPRKYYYAKSLQLQAIESSLAAQFGAAIHEGVACFWKCKGCKTAAEIIEKYWPSYSGKATNNRQELATLLSVQAFVDAWSTVKEQDIKRSNASGILIMSKYCSTYERDTSCFLPENIEVFQPVEMPNGTMLYSRIDRVKTEGGFHTIVDTKTSSSSLTDYYFRQFENSFQMSCYFYIVQQLFGQCDCLQIDAIKVPYTEKEGFVRRSFPRGELQMAEFLSTYRRITEQIKEGFSLGEEAQLMFFYQNPTSCGDYGGCKYLSLCKYGLKHPSLGIEFTRAEAE